MTTAAVSTLGRGRRSVDAVRSAIGSINPRTLRLLSALGWAMALAGAVLIVGYDGGSGYDSYAYWLAGRNVLEGNPLYWVHAEGDLGAFRYPPLFAQVAAPFALLPELAFSWLWRLVCLLSLRYLAGSWRNVGLWFLVPLTLLELWIANVTFPTAALTVAALRGRTEAAPWAGALKIGPLLAVPYLWFVDRPARGRLLLGIGVLIAVCAASYVIAPESWSLYLQALTWMSSTETADRWGVITLLPQSFQDALLRFGIAIALVVLAIWRRSDRLVYVATIIAVPVLAVWRLVPLLALPRLPPDRTEAAATK